MFCDNWVLVFRGVELPNRAPPPTIFFHKFQSEYILGVNIKKTK